MKLFREAKADSHNIRFYFFDLLSYFLIRKAYSI